MKVTLVPAHTGFSDAAILTPAATIGLTVIVIVLEVAGLPLAQLTLDVITQETVFPLVSADVV